tara:strand:- start:3685 stop:4692 length:1008 start_codon:yes stop_codon:yes gene_type:complete
MKDSTLKFPSTRLRRNRQSNWIRNLVEEHSLTSNDLIWPVFICEGKNKKEEIKSMPNVYRYSIDNLNEVRDIAESQNINLIAIFPYTPEELKSNDGKEALNPENLVCKSIDQLSRSSKSFGLMCDVALDPYTDHGHDGLINDSGKIINDETNELLVKQALLYAECGADVIAPSDMMDGRIGMIRNQLEKNDFQDTLILSYAAKYASAMYSPFRDAVGSSSSLKSDKKTYQMNINNSDEAIREASMDISEGADILMVKPGISYLDIIYRIKHELNFPTFAYQVSGEYSLIKLAADKGLVDEKAVVLEQLASFKRAGADAIITYFAPEVSKFIKLTE